MTVRAVVADAFLAAITDGHCCCIRERPGWTTFRFWQEGGGYDRNVTSVQTLTDAILALHSATMSGDDSPVSNQ